MKKHKKKDAPKRTGPTGSAVTVDGILAQLASMKDNARSFQAGEDPDPIWQADIDACEAATDILSALQDEGLNDAEQVRDMIADYHALAEQYRNMHQRYEEPADPLKLGADRLCPQCHSRLYHSPEHCEKCGKKIRWGGDTR